MLIKLFSLLTPTSAKDDAAGQAIANRMTSQITGLSQAQRNSNDGISVAQTAEGALNQVNDNLQRVRELAVQAQNGTNSQDDLNSIQAEIGQRLNEINRISEETDFNGTKVLAKNQELKIQVGANDGESISINLEKIDASSLGVSSFNVSGPDFGDDGTGMAIGDALKEEFGSTTELATTALTADPTPANWQDALDVDTVDSVGAASVVADDNGQFFMTQQLTVTDADSKAQLDALGIEPTAAGADTYDVYVAVDPQEATPNTTTTSQLDFTVDLADYTKTELSGASTADPLETLDDALSKVDTLRSDLGAIQNRFESAITNLQTNETNLSAARSRIEDADYATEVANMTRAQILQQAGTSVLAQANQIPQNVLSLLG